MVSFFFTFFTDRIFVPSGVERVRTALGALVRESSERVHTDRLLELLLFPPSVCTVTRPSDDDGCFFWFAKAYKKRKLPDGSVRCVQNKKENENDKKRNNNPYHEQRLRGSRGVHGK